MPLEKGQKGREMKGGYERGGRTKERGERDKRWVKA
jgi:hypothetical protein